MAGVGAVSLSKADYLKRYLSDASDEKKKRKKKKPKAAVLAPRSRIVDDDVDFTTTLPENLANTLDEDIGDDDPTVAEVIDERPDHVKRLEAYRNTDSKWRLMNKSEKEDNSSDVSPLRRNRHDSDSDQSPPRRGKRNDSDSDQSPPRRRKRNDSDSDQSPPRRKKRNDSDSDQSPPRRKKRNDSDSDQSPPRRRKRNDSDSDQSPPRRRKRNDSDSDQSPPRISNKGDNKKTQKNSDDKMKRTLSGKRAGLSSAADMKKEALKMKVKEEAAFKKIGVEQLGKDAATVFRDKKSGRRRNLAQEEEETAEERALKAVRDAKYQEWGKGLKQKAEKESMMKDHLHEVNKPLARYRDDDDLDNMLREQDREGDPMLAFIKKKKQKGSAKVKELPRYKGPPGPPNRYGIPPGYRWDGVNRSNGFEAQLFAKMSDRKAVANQAYKWSVEDM